MYDSGYDLTSTVESWIKNATPWEDLLDEFIVCELELALMESKASLVTIHRSNPNSAFSVPVMQRVQDEARRAMRARSSQRRESVASFGSAQGIGRGNRTTTSDSEDASRSRKSKRVSKKLVRKRQTGTTRDSTPKSTRRNSTRSSSRSTEPTPSPVRKFTVNNYQVRKTK